MKRLLLLATALVTFLLGVAVSRLINPMPARMMLRTDYSGCSKARFKASLGHEQVPHRYEFRPLQVRLSSVTQPANKQFPYEHRYAVVQNVGTIPVRYYVLGFGTDISNVGASTFVTDNGFTYTYPDLSRGPLMPGEMRAIPVKANAEFSEEAFVWVDYMEFEDGLAWGPNKSRTPRIKR